MALASALAIAACLSTAAYGWSRPQDVGAPPYGILVMAHGGDDLWNQRVEQAVTRVAADVPIRLAFGMADRASLAVAVAALEATGVRRIAVVRLFVSGASFLPQTRYLLGLDKEPPAFLFDGARQAGMRPVVDPSAVPPIPHESTVSILAEGLVDAPLSGRILAQRALAISTAPSREAVVVIAHGQGPEDENHRLLATLRARARSIERAAPFRKVEVFTLREDWDAERAIAEREIREFVARESVNGDVIVVPFRVFGFGPYREVLDGLAYEADGVGLLPHDEVGDWVLTGARRVACGNGWITSCDFPFGVPLE